MENKTVFGSLQSNQTVYFNPESNTFYSTAPGGAGVSPPSSLDPLYVKGLENLKAQGGGVATTANTVMVVQPPEDTRSGWSIKGIPVSEGVAQKVLADQALPTAAPTNYGSMPTDMHYNYQPVPRPLNLTGSNITPSYAGTFYTGEKQPEFTPTEMEKIRSWSTSPAGVLTSAFSNDPFMIRTLFYTGVASAGGYVSLFDKDLGKKISNYAFSNVESIRLEHGKDIYRQYQVGTPTDVALTMGGRAATISLLATGTMLTGAPGLIGTGAKTLAAGLYGIQVGRTIENPTPENIFFTSLPPLAYAGSKILGSMKREITGSKEVSYDYEYQTYYGEGKKIYPNYPSSAMDQKTLYGSPLEKMPNVKMADELVYLNIKGYKTAELYTGDVVKIPVDLKIKFRIDERSGLYQPVGNQFLTELDIWQLKGGGVSKAALGKPTYDFDIKPFTWSKEGWGTKVNIEGWEREFTSIEKPVPISYDQPYYKGTGYNIFEQRLMGDILSPQKDITIKEVSITKFFLEPETRKVTTSFQSPTPHKIGDYPSYDVWVNTRDLTLFEQLGIKDLTKVGGLAGVEIPSGKLVSGATEAAEKLNILQLGTGKVSFKTAVLGWYDYARYPEAPLSVGLTTLSGLNLGAARSDLSSIRNIPIIINYAKPDLKAGTILTPEYHQIIKPDLRSISDLVPGLKSEPEMRSIIEPKLQPLLEPKLETRLEPRLLARLEPRLNMRLETKMDLRNMLYPKPHLITTGKELKDYTKLTKARSGGFIFLEKKTKAKVIVNPRADPLAYRISQKLYGSATHPKATKAIKRSFVKEFYRSPLGMSFGKFETKETKKSLKQLIKGGW